MQCRDDDNTSYDEINATIDELLEGDRRELCPGQKRCHAELLDAPEERDHCVPKRQICPKEIRRQRYVGVESSRRFSLRVLEAMRAIQRRREEAKCPSTCSTTADILGFCQANFQCDGDLDSQIRTALKRLTCQGFVQETSCDTYDLIGPVACSLTRAHRNLFSQPMGNVTTTHRETSTRPRPKTKKTRKDNSEAKDDDSDIYLSIPSSLSDNTQRRRPQRSRPKARSASTSRKASKSRRCFYEAGDYDDCPRSNLSEPLNNSNGGGSSAGGESAAAVGSRASADAASRLDNAPAHDDPVSRLNLGPLEFHDDGLDDEYELPEEEKCRRNDAGNSNDEEVEEQEDYELASDDSAMREIRMREKRQLDEARQRELSKWIKNCRRECLKRAQQQEVQID